MAGPSEGLVNGLPITQVPNVRSMECLRTVQVLVALATLVLIHLCNLNLWLVPTRNTGFVNGLQGKKQSGAVHWMVLQLPVVKLVEFVVEIPLKDLVLNTKGVQSHVLVFGQLIKIQQTAVQFLKSLPSVHLPVVHAKYS